MEQIGRRVFLYDFYGELLTDHQKEVYGDVVLNDMSLGEIARERGISRQGVHDMIKRCDRILAGYEEKLHPDHAEEILTQIHSISGRILEEL